MTIKKVFLTVDDTPPGRSTLQTAIRLCRLMDAHLVAVHVKPDLTAAITLIGEGLSGGLVDEISLLTDQESARRREAARTLFDSLIAEAAVTTTATPGTVGPTAEWVDASGRETDAIIRFGRLADVTVLGRPAEALTSPAGEALHAALYETGRPVVIAPRAMQQTFGRRVTVAWNGSIEAVRAVAAALPLLAKAEAVTVVTAGNTDSGAGEDLLAFLAWHGVAAHHRAGDGGGDVGERLLRAAEGSDILVMGAFTHSRLREWILGGVTRHLLEHDGPTLFMAH